VAHLLHQEISGIHRRWGRLIVDPAVDDVCDFLHRAVELVQKSRVWRREVRKPGRARIKDWLDWFERCPAIADGGSADGRRDEIGYGAAEDINLLADNAGQFWREIVPGGFGAAFFGRQRSLGRSGTPSPSRSATNDQSRSGPIPLSVTSCGRQRRPGSRSEPERERSRSAFALLLTHISAPAIKPARRAVIATSAPSTSSALTSTGPMWNRRCR
jgi:hypothetical protein